MIQKPYDINIQNKILDGNNDFLLKWKTSGDTSTGFSISIYNNSNNILSWALPRTYSLGLSYTIPQGSLLNGVDYKINITVWNSNNESATSDYVVFTASSTPSVTVDPIGVVKNHSYLFTSTYSQAENEPLQCYVVNLFDNNQILINSSGIMTDGLLEYRFDLMKNGLTYYVEFIVTSKIGLSKSSGLISFDVVYDNPYMYFNPKVENLNDTASIRLHWSVVQVIGKTDVEPVYINNEELDVSNGKVFFDEGYGIVNDFTLKLWFRGITSNVDLVYLKGSNGNIRVWYSDFDHKFHLLKDVNSFVSHYVTEQLGGGYFVSPNLYDFEADVNSSFFLCIQQDNGRINLVGELVS